MSIYAKEFLAIYKAFKEFGHIFWGATKPVSIMTDSKSVTRFFQTKMIPPPLWNACDFVLHFNFTNAHILGKMNTAADFSFRLEMDPNEKKILNIREDIPTKPIEVSIESTGIAQKETVFLTPQIDKKLQKKNFGNVRKKREMPHLPIHQSSQCRVTTQKTYTKTQQS